MDVEEDTCLIQAAVAVIAGAASYMQRRTPSGDAFGGSSGSTLTAPFAAVGSAFGWIKNKIPGNSRCFARLGRP